MLNLIAHAGHGQTDGFSLLHWLIEPAHLPLTIAAGVAFAIVGFAWVRKHRTS
jgi:hypothetical protein